MSLFSGDVQTQLLKFVGTIPRDVNPYEALADHIKDGIAPKVPFSGMVQLYALSGILGATLLLVVVSLLIRWMKGIFWVFQLSHSPTLIRPHFSISWSLIAVLMLVMFELYIVECVHLFKRDLRPVLGWWVLNVWTPPFVGGAWAAWSLGVSYLAHLQASGEDVNIERWAKFANYSGVLSPLLYLAIMLPVGLTTSKHFETAVSTYLQVDRLLRDTAQDWIPGTALNIAKLTPALPLLPKLESAQAKLVRGWKWEFGLYTVLTFLLVASLTATAALHLNSLRRRINRTAQELRGIDHSRAVGEQIRRTYQTLVATVVAFVFLGTTFSTIAAYAAAQPAALTHPLTCQVLVLAPLYCFSLLGFPTAASLVWRAWEAKGSDTGRWNEASHGTSSAERSRQRRDDLEAVKKYSIELGGRSRQNNAVNVTVDVLVKEEGGVHELEKWESLSSTKN